MSVFYMFYVDGIFVVSITARSLKNKHFNGNDSLDIIRAAVDFQLLLLGENSFKLIFKKFSNNVLVFRCRFIIAPCFSIA